MTISLGSLQTGLPRDIVKQLMEAEKIPITNLENRKTKLNDKINLVNELNKLLEDLRKDIRANIDINSFRELKVATNNDIIDVNLDPKLALPGEYHFQVDDLAQKSSAMTSGFEDPNNSNVGVGYIQYSLPTGESRSIFVDSAHSSLNGIADLVNKNPEMGMRALVVNDGFGGDEPWRIIFTVLNPGDDNLANFPYFYFVDGENDFYLEYEREAHDALVLVDGQEVELPKNSKIDNLIPGMSIDLKKAKPGEEFTIKVEENTAAIKDKVQKIIEKINNVLQFIYNQNKLDQNSDTSRTLGGDLSIQSIESRLRNIIFTSFETSYGPRRLGDFGVIFQRNGLLNIDEKKIGQLIQKDFSQFSQFMLGFYDQDEEVQKTGFIQEINRLIDSFVNIPDGTITLRKEAIRTNIRQIDKRIEDTQRLLEKKEAMLKDKFSKLEGVINNFKTQGAGLAGIGQGTEQGNPQQ